MVLGDKHCKHTDEGPCRSSRRTRSPSAAVLASAAAAATFGTTSTDDADGMFYSRFQVLMFAGAASVKISGTH